MRYPTRHSSSTALPRAGSRALRATATNTEGAGKKKLKPKKKKDPANLCEDDLCFIAEAKHRRRLLGWSQKKVAEMVGVTRSAVQLIENWQRGLSLRMAGDFARAFSSDTGLFIAAGRKKKNKPEFAALFPEMPKFG